MSKLELKVPPVVVALIIGGISWLLAATGLELPFPFSIRLVLAAMFLIAGIGIAVAGVVEFVRAKTTVNPHRPRHTSVLVTGGIYRYTRNPMYVGMAGVLTAHALARGGWATWLPVAGFVAVIDRVQVQPEEAALGARFGDEYEDYRRRVRRWL
jgi:protein-S-isoprenylcysteine O-methyltransferase Ste14